MTFYKYATYMELTPLLFYLAILIISVVVHEVSHGAVAYMLGDPTAKMAGRLTLNPVVHIDPFGSLLLPLLLIVAHLPPFGWAKPVPYNPYNLKNQKWGSALVGAAGPLANLAIAASFGTLLRFLPLAGNPTLDAAAIIITMIVYLNISLGIFNLLPIPPLDGSKVLFALPMIPLAIKAILSQYGFFILIIFIFFGSHIIMPLIYFMFYLFTGHTISSFL